MGSEAGVPDFAVMAGQTELECEVSPESSKDLL